MEPDEFEKAFQAWVHELAGTTVGKHIAIDGKTLRRSFDRASEKAAIHMVSAWVHENHAVFGQLKIDEKSNEIKAIPKLLKMLNLKEATVTIDGVLSVSQQSYAITGELKQNCTGCSMYALEKTTAGFG